MPQPSALPDEKDLIQMTATPSAGSSLTRRDVRVLQGEAIGPVTLPGDTGYAEECAAFNVAVTNVPAVVVGATCPEDVLAAVRFARQLSLPVGVLATGHQPSRPADGAVLINTRRMNEVIIDAPGRVARVAAGVVSGQLVDAAAEHGLAPLNGSSVTVGVAGTPSAAVSARSRDGYAAGQPTTFAPSRW
jgi:hypothetical protein